MSALAEGSQPSRRSGWLGAPVSTPFPSGQAVTADGPGGRPTPLALSCCSMQLAGIEPQGRCSGEKRRTGAKPAETAPSTGALECSRQGEKEKRFPRLPRRWLTGRARWLGKGGCVRGAQHRLGTGIAASPRGVTRPFSSPL